MSSTNMNTIIALIVLAVALIIIIIINQISKYRISKSKNKFQDNTDTSNSKSNSDNTDYVKLIHDWILKSESDISSIKKQVNEIYNTSIKHTDLMIELNTYISKNNSSDTDYAKLIHEWFLQPCEKYGLTPQEKIIETHSLMISQKYSIADIKSLAETSEKNINKLFDVLNKHETFLITIKKNIDGLFGVLKEHKTLLNTLKESILSDIKAEKGKQSSFLNIIIAILLIILIGVIFFYKH